MAALDVLVLKEATPQIIVPATGTDTYNMPSATAIAAGTATTAVKALSVTQTWNNVATTFPGAIFANVTNTASAAASLLMDLQVGGNTALRVRKDGLITVANAGLTAFASFQGGTYNGEFSFSSGNAGYLNGNNIAIQVQSNGRFAFTATTTNDGNSAYDAAFSRISAGVIGVGTGAAASVAGILQAAEFRAAPGTAIPAGGTAGLGHSFSSTANFGVYFGSGAPTLSAAKGSLYMRSDGTGIADRAYINTNGTTTWTNLVTAA